MHGGSTFDSVERFPTTWLVRCSLAYTCWDNLPRKDPARCCWVSRPGSRRGGEAIPYRRLHGERLGMAVIRGSSPLSVG